MSLSIGARSVPGNFKRYLEGSRKGASLSVGALLREPGGGAPFMGIWKDMGKRAEGTDITL